MTKIVPPDVSAANEAEIAQLASRAQPHQEDETDEPEFTTTRVRRRRGKYEPEHCDTVRAACDLGATDAEIAEILEIALSTLYEWKAKHPDFSKSFRVAKENADLRVERSLFQRATGYEIDAVKIFAPKGESDDPIYAEYREHIPADPGAAYRWLLNRQPERWKDRREIAVDGKLTLLQLVLASMGEIPVEALEEQVKALEGPTKTA